MSGAFPGHCSKCGKWEGDLNAFPNYPDMEWYCDECYSEIDMLKILAASKKLLDRWGDDRSGSIFAWDDLGGLRIPARWEAIKRGYLAESQARSHRGYTLVLITEKGIEYLRKHAVNPADVPKPRPGIAIEWGVIPKDES